MAVASARRKTEPTRPLPTNLMVVIPYRPNGCDTGWSMILGLHICGGRSTPGQRGGGTYKVLARKHFVSPRTPKVAYSSAIPALLHAKPTISPYKMHQEIQHLTNA